MRCIYSLTFEHLAMNLQQRKYKVMRDLNALTF